MKTYITICNTNPGAWEGKKSEASTKIGIMDEDGSNLRYLDLEKIGIEGQNTWASCGVIVLDGKKKMVLASSEGGMCHLPTTKRNLWTYDFETEDIIKIYDIEDRPNDIEFIRQLSDDKIMIVERLEYSKCKYYSCDIDGGNKKEIKFILPKGYTYHPNVTPDKKHFIIQHAAPYALWKCGIEGGECELLVSKKDHYCFGNAVSFDSKWVGFTDFSHNDDPTHEWANVSIVGIEDKKRVDIIKDKSYWNSAQYGDETVKGGNSNGLDFTPFGNYLTLVKGIKGSKGPWKKAPEGTPDDHFMRVYDRSIAKGGTGITIKDIYSGEEIEITKAVEGNWDFRPKWNKESHKLLFTRSKTGEKPEIWMVDKDGKNEKFLTRGYKDVGADFPNWI